MKRLTFEIIIEEGCDEFWEDVAKRGVTGCDDVLEILQRDLFHWSEKIRLVKYEDK